MRLGLRVVIGMWMFNAVIGAVAAVFDRSWDDAIICVLALGIAVVGCMVGQGAAE